MVKGEKKKIASPPAPPVLLQWAQSIKPCPGHCAAWLISHQSYKKQSLGVPSSACQLGLQIKYFPPFLFHWWLPQGRESSGRNVIRCQEWARGRKRKHEQTSEHLSSLITVHKIVIIIMKFRVVSVQRMALKALCGFCRALTRRLVHVGKWFSSLLQMLSIASSLGYGSPTV